eukprot:121509_1
MVISDKWKQRAIYFESNDAKILSDTADDSDYYCKAVSHITIQMRNDIFNCDLYCYVDEMFLQSLALHPIYCKLPNSIHIKHYTYQFSSNAVKNGIIKSVGCVGSHEQLTTDERG